MDDEEGCSLKIELIREFGLPTIRTRRLGRPRKGSNRIPYVLLEMVSYPQILPENSGRSTSE